MKIKDLITLFILIAGVSFSFFIFQLDFPVYEWEANLEEYFDRKITVSRGIEASSTVVNVICEKRSEYEWRRYIKTYN